MRINSLVMGLAVAGAMLWAGSARAQLVVGGELGFDVRSGSTVNAAVGTSTETKDPTVMTLNVYPSVGYILGNGFTVGTKIGVNYTNTNNNDAANTVKGETTLKIAPYVKYNVVDFNNFTVALRADVPVSYGIGSVSAKVGDKTVTTDLPNQLGLAVKITPELGYALTSHFRLYTALNFLSFGYDMVRTDEVTNPDPKATKTVTKHHFGLNLDTKNVLSMSSLTIGVRYVF